MSGICASSRRSSIYSSTGKPSAEPRRASASAAFHRTSATGSSIIARSDSAAPGAPAAAQVDFGVRAGAYLEDADPFVGLELLTRMGSTEWFFNPNVEFIFADERDGISGNFDFHYDFVTTGDYYVWAGGGLAIINTEGPGGQDDETDAGANLLGGIGWRLRGDHKRSALFDTANRPLVEPRVLNPAERENLRRARAAWRNEAPAAG